MIAPVALHHGFIRKGYIDKSIEKGYKTLECDPLAWLSELVGQRDYITRAVQDLDFLVAH